jgi:hypothetical protein
MAIPDVNIPIKPVYFPWEVVIKAERAAEKVHERMLRPRLEEIRANPDG